MRVNRTYEEYMALKQSQYNKILKAKEMIWNAYEPLNNNGNLTAVMRKQLDMIMDPINRILGYIEMELISTEMRHTYVKSTRRRTKNDNR